MSKPIPNTAPSPTAAPSAQMNQPQGGGNPIFAILAQTAQHLDPQQLGQMIFQGLNPQQQQQLQVHFGTPDQNGVGTDYGASMGGNSIGAYSEPGLLSAGGKIGGLGGTVGVANGQAFGSMNFNGKSLGQFGQQ